MRARSRPIGLTMAGVAWDIVGPYVYAGYPWLNSFGYGLPLAYGLPYGNDQDDAGGPQPAPQQADYGDQPPAITDQNLQALKWPPTLRQPFRPAYQAQVDAAPVHASARHHLDFQGWPPASAGA